MGTRPVVDAVIVNHNTSLFAELALLSLIATHATAADACDLKITVLDNHSTDDELARLMQIAEAVGASFELSAWPAADTTINSHGDALRDFVVGHDDADYFLFVDADIDFEEPSTLQVMLDDLTDDPDLWAVQARFGWTEEHQGPGASLNIWAGRPVDLEIRTTGDGIHGAQQLEGRIRGRLHPGCALIKNSAPVRVAAESFGFGIAVVQSTRPDVAGLFDTAGLTTAALAVAGLRYRLSRATVHHFFNVSYETEQLERKITDCKERLQRFWPAS